MLSEAQRNALKTGTVDKRMRYRMRERYAQTVTDLVAFLHAEHTPPNPRTHYERVDPDEYHRLLRLLLADTPNNYLDIDDDLTGVRQQLALTLLTEAFQDYDFANPLAAPIDAYEHTAIIQALARRLEAE